MKLDPDDEDTQPRIGTDVESADVDSPDDCSDTYAQIKPRHIPTEHHGCRTLDILDQPALNRRTRTPLEDAPQEQIDVEKDWCTIQQWQYRHRYHEQNQHIDDGPLTSDPVHKHTANVSPGHASRSCNEQCDRDAFKCKTVGCHKR